MFFVTELLQYVAGTQLPKISYKNKGPRRSVSCFPHGSHKCLKEANEQGFKATDPSNHRPKPAAGTQEVCCLQPWSKCRMHTVYPLSPSLFKTLRLMAITTS